MKKEFLGTTILIVILIGICVPAHSESLKDTIAFSQIRPYLACLFYFDQPSGQMRMCHPDQKWVKEELTRRNLTDRRILLLIWQANINMFERADNDSIAEEWMNLSFVAGSQAMTDLDGIAEKIGHGDDYFDLLDIRLSQILLSDRKFIVPLCDELFGLIEGDTTIECAGCKLELEEYLKTLDSTSSE